MTILPGKNKCGAVETFSEIILSPGDVLSVVGSTGSGKTAFINDIEVLAQGDTATGRTILINGCLPPDDFIRDPSKKPIAMITQNTKCLADLTVRKFLEMHIRSRKISENDVLEKTISTANKFTGEKIHADMRVSSLSGGQTRSLFIADAVIISDTPILLLDELENAGIFKEKVIEELRTLGKTTIFVTHDPYVSLLTDRRIVMENGTVKCILEPNGCEKEVLLRISGMDRELSAFRERIRRGEILADLNLTDSNHVDSTHTDSNFADPNLVESNSVDLKKEVFT
ncbi:ATP-binding cassette domain-containing protein [Methanimicrococcus stummii]|uniref:ATP-binding cassette domain-containing protein n=1 Tax=Methanimicrococcus stummii TaxID=3028294 RepID=UPI00292CE3EC|nr:ATP-binding cassette domain-containing protein [Methanimicrococcus sp. Es2]